MKFTVYHKDRYLMQGGAAPSIERRVKEFALTCSNLSPSNFICWTKDKKNNPLKLRFDDNFKLIDLSWVD